MKLYTYWRSSSAYRVRIALNLKGLDYESVPVHLVRDGGEQHRPEYTTLNPLGLVPTLVDKDRVLIESLAIIEYLEETFPEPALLPSTVAERARVRGMALSIACEIQPLNNSAVLGFLTSQLGVSETGKLDWICKWIARGFGALEHLLTRSAETGVYCHGDTPSVADLCLVPQVYNAVRFDVDLGSYPTLMGIHDRCQQLEAFIKAAPENQSDAQPA